MKNFFQYSKSSPKLEVRDTKKYGKGVFAGEDIKKGRIIHVLSGKKMDILDLVRRVNSDKENIDDPLQIGKRTYIDLDKFSRCFNHSCNPNSGLRKNSEMFALSPIKKGDEITFDYSLTILPTIWEMECKCGAKNCRRKLGDISTLTRARLKYYKKAGSLQRYIKPLLDSILDSTYEVPKYEILALQNVKKTSNR